MDNISHTLVGAGIAYLFIKDQTLSDTEKRVVIASSVAASNIPDLDLLYTWITPGPLGYLLHHRGHTHTFLFAILFSLLSFAVLSFLPKSKNQWLNNLKNLIIIVTLIGLITHILLDGLNSYGVHPFWPFDNSWYYTDTLFIIEPILWILLSITLLRHCTHLISRIMLYMILSAAITLLLFSGYIETKIALAVTFLSCLFYIYALKVSKQQLLNSALTLVVLVCIIFNLAMREAKSRVREIYQENFSAEEIDQLIATPNPSNPQCWSFIAVSTDSSNYILRRGSIALFSAIKDSCPATNKLGDLLKTNYTITHLPKSIEQDQFIAQGSYSLKLSRLKELYNKSCHLQAYFRFARAPLIIESEDQILISDLRFNKKNKKLGNFAELKIDLTKLDQNCPANVPDWLAPINNIINSNS